MARAGTDLAWAAGKLISAIQKEWGAEIGTASAAEGEAVMDRAHTLLQAVKAKQLTTVLAGKSVKEFLGAKWLETHPAVQGPMQTFEKLLNDSGAA